MKHLREQLDGFVQRRLGKELKSLQLELYIRARGAWMAAAALAGD
jgi:hypothetical protein